MPLPPNLDTVTVFGESVTITGRPAKGTIIFTPSFDSPLRPTAGGVYVVPDTIKVHLNSGEFSVQIPATDDPDFLPGGWAWKVIVDIDEWKPEPFYMEAPRGPAIDLFAVVPVDVPPIFERYVRTVNGVGPDSGGNVIIETGARYTHTQEVPATVWTVNHNLGFRPVAVSMFSSDFGQQWSEFGVQHLDVNSLRITTDIAVAGIALIG